ncbi:hypothetical protein D3C78_1605430 [compost metagenome]
MAPRGLASCVANSWGEAACSSRRCGRRTLSTAQASAALASSLLALVNSEIRVNISTFAAREAMAAICQLVSSST